MKVFEFKVEIEMDFDCKKSQALVKLRRWLEYEGHSSSSFGFSFRALEHLKESDK